MADDELTRLRVEPCGERPVDQLARLVIAERLEDQRLAGGEPRRPGRVVPRINAGPAASDSTLTTARSAARWPSEILQHDDGRTASPNVRHQAHPCFLEREHRRPRLEVAGDVEAQGQPKDLVARDLLEREILFP